MTPKKISKETARRFLISRQGFHRSSGKTGTLESIKRLECVQIDPVRVIHRNHHLVLHNRVSDYRPSHLNALLYEDRAVFEYWCNGKSIIPTEEFRYFRYRMKNYTEFHSPFYERLKARRKQHEDDIHHILSIIKAEGPVCAQDFKENMGGKAANRILNLLWDSGEVMIHHVEGNLRHYDLTEHILPKGLNTETPSREEYDRFMAEKYMRAYGFVDVRDWRFGWLDLRTAQRKTLVKKMVEEKKLFPVKIEGIKHIYYVLEACLSDLEAAEDFSIKGKARFIAPLDNLIWNRRMIAEVFDFSYSWEIYKPPEKRQYGYYTMPILSGTSFVGRIDPKLDRKTRTLIINTLILEEKRLQEDTIAELMATLGNFISFHDACQVNIVKTEPKRLRNALLTKLDQSAYVKALSSSRLQEDR